jgi:hypothetical protein
VLSDWLTVLVWVTFVPSVLSSAARLLSYTLTPLATRASVELTILTPLAPSSAVPLRLTAPVADVVTDELFAAIDPPDAEELSL